LIVEFFVLWRTGSLEPVGKLVRGGRGKSKHEESEGSGKQGAEQDAELRFVDQIRPSWTVLAIGEKLYSLERVFRKAQISASFWVSRNVPDCPIWALSRRKHGFESRRGHQRKRAQEIHKAPAILSLVDDAEKIRKQRMISSSRR